MGKTQAPRISDFQKQCKLFFSSLSGRGCTKLYINLPGRQNQLILSNADPDILATYSTLGMIGIHRIIPSQEFMDEFRKLFFSTGDINQPYLIKTEYITKSFKNNRVEQVVSHIDSEGNLRFINGKDVVQVAQEEDEEDEKDQESEEESETTDEQSSSSNEWEALLKDDGWDTKVKRINFKDVSISGVPIKDPYILEKLETVLNEIDCDISQVEANTSKVITFDYSDFAGKFKVHSNLYKSPKFDVHALLPHITEDECIPQSILITDGLSCPCLSEFLKKQNWTEDGTGYRFYVYLCTEDTVKSISHYWSPRVDIVSTKPFSHETLLLFFKEEKEKKLYRHVTNSKEVLHHA